MAARNDRLDLFTMMTWQEFLEAGGCSSQRTSAKFASPAFAASVQSSRMRSLRQREGTT